MAARGVLVAKGKSYCLYIRAPWQPALKTEPQSQSLTDRARTGSARASESSRCAVHPCERSRAHTTAGGSRGGSDLADVLRPGDRRVDRARHSFGRVRISVRRSGRACNQKPPPSSASYSSSAPIQSSRHSGNSMFGSRSVPSMKRPPQIAQESYRENRCKPSVFTHGVIPGSAILRLCESALQESTRLA
jgi:hypothetical protein